MSTISPGFPPQNDEPRPTEYAGFPPQDNVNDVWPTDYPGFPPQINDAARPKNSPRYVPRDIAPPVDLWGYGRNDNF